MLQEKRQELINILTELNEFKLVRSLSPELFDENGRPTGIVQYPAAIVVFDRVDIDEYTNNSDLRRYYFDIWIATLYTRGKEEQQENEVFCSKSRSPPSGLQYG